MRKRLFLETEVTNCITVETIQYDKFYSTQYRIKGKKIRTLQRYQSEKKAKQGHRYWSNIAWPIRAPVEVEDQGQRRWKAIRDHWRWLDPDDPEDDELYYEYWGWLDLLS